MNEITEDNFGEEIAPYLVHHNDAHTEVQLDFFVIGNGGEGHPWGMYRQAMRELASRQAMLVGAIHSRAMLRLDLEEKELDYSDCKSAPENDSHRLSIWRSRLQLEIELTVQKIAADDARVERIMFEGRRILERTRELQEELVAEHGELTDEVRRRLDEEFWVHSFKQRIALAALTRTAIPRDITTVLPLLPRRMSAPIIRALRDPEAAIESFGFTDPQKLALKGVG